MTKPHKGEPPEEFLFDLSYGLIITERKYRKTDNENKNENFYFACLFCIGEIIFPMG